MPSASGMSAAILYTDSPRNGTAQRSRLVPIDHEPKDFSPKKKTPGDAGASLRGRGSGCRGLLTTVWRNVRTKLTHDKMTRSPTELAHARTTFGHDADSFVSEDRRSRLPGRSPLRMWRFGAANGGAIILR